MIRCVVFLDVDGVLNRIGTKLKSPEGYVGIEPARVRVLRRMVEENDAAIVLTSTWKSEWDPDPERMGPDGRYLAEALGKEGLSIADRITDPFGDGRRRGLGIRNWLAQNGNLPFVVLDDEFFPDFRSTKITRHLIRTSCMEGLKDNHVTAAGRLVRAQLQRPEAFTWQGEDALDLHCAYAHRGRALETPGEEEHGGREEA